MNDRREITASRVERSRGAKKSAVLNALEAMSPRTRAWLRYLTVVGVGGIALFSLQLLSPMVRHYVIREGGILENLSATFHLFAVLVGGWACYRARPEIRRRYLAIPILAVLGFYDEISDGIFMEPVLEFRGIKLTALHEWIHAGYNLWRDLETPGAQIFVLVLVAGIAGFLGVRYRARIRAAIGLLKRDTSYQLVVIGIAQAAVALVLDRELATNRFTFYEEWLEMNMAMAMLFAAREIPESGRPPTAIRVAFLICVPIAIGLGPVFACMFARCPVP
jgi:hypothetical protein